MNSPRNDEQTTDNEISYLDYSGISVDWVWDMVTAILMTI